MQARGSIQILFFLSTMQASSNQAAKNVTTALQETTLESITVSATMTSTRLQQHSQSRILEKHQHWKQLLKKWSHYDLKQ